MSLAVAERITKCRGLDITAPRGVSPHSAVTTLDKLEYLPISSSHAVVRSVEKTKSALSAGKAKCQKTIDPVKTLENRTRSKALDWVVKGRLMNDSGIKSVSPLHGHYVKSTACNGVLTQEEGKIKAFYCKERWCSVCNRIRTGVLFNKYEPVIRDWEDKYFVSLTLRNPRADELPQTIDEMIRLFGMCAESIKQTKKMRFLALRKLEVTYNVRENTYHPHFHAIVQGKEQAEELQSYWLGKVNKYRGKDGDVAVIGAQKVVKCDNDTVRELFKYFTKLINDQMMYPVALDTIFRAMRGRRTFQAYLPKEVQRAIKQRCDEEEFELDRSTPAITRLDEKIYWDYIPAAKTYVDKETGETLTNYRPSKTFVRLLDKLGGIDPKPNENAVTDDEADGMATQVRCSDLGEVSDFRTSDPSFDVTASGYGSSCGGWNGIKVVINHGKEPSTEGRRPWRVR